MRQDEIAGLLVAALLVATVAARASFQTPLGMPNPSSGASAIHSSVSLETH